MRTKLKNVRTGAVIERTYRADEKLDQAMIDKREMQFLYVDGDAYVFMDNTDYEQLHAPVASLGSSARYLKEGDSAVLQMYEAEIVGVDLPAAVELTVTETEPGVQGDRVSGARKPATLETGLLGAGAALREHRRQGQSRHPDRGVPDPRRKLTVSRRVLPSTRREARERALALLYEAESKQLEPAVVLADLPVPPDPFVADLVTGVQKEQARIDDLIARTPSAGRSIGCRSSTGPCSGWPLTSFWLGPTCRPAR